MLYFVLEHSNCHSGTCIITQKAYIRQKFTVHFSPTVQGVSEGIVNILGGGSMDYSE